MKCLLGLSAGLIATVAVSLPAGAPPIRPDEAIELRRCIVEYRDATQMGASTYGILVDCLVDLGDEVKAGQVLGRLQDLEQKAGVIAAQAKYLLARTRLRTATPLLRGRGISKDEYDILRGEVEYEAGVVEAARASVRVRELVSPYNGVVVGIFKKKGESVQMANDPVFRVVNVDVLRVVGYLDLPDAWRVRVNQAVSVTPESTVPRLVIKDEEFRGRVVFVDSEVDQKTQTCKVVAEVKNRDRLLKAGLEVRMTIGRGPAQGLAVGGRGRLPGRLPDRGDARGRAGQAAAGQPLRRCPGERPLH